MELLSIFGVGAITILGLVAANRANQYKKLLEQSNKELLSIKLTHSKLQLLDYFDSTNKGI
jgi:hypothetical protein